MIAEFYEGRLRLLPDSVDEENQIDTMFPNHFLKTSRSLSIRELVDGFGAPTGKRYLEIRGINALPRTSARKNTAKAVDVANESVVDAVVAGDASVAEPHREAVGA